MLEDSHFSETQGIIDKFGQKNVVVIEQGPWKTIPSNV
jgi:hypothetical protein